MIERMVVTNLVPVDGGFVRVSAEDSALIPRTLVVDVDAAIGGQLAIGQELKPFEIAGGTSASKEEAVTSKR